MDKYCNECSECVEHGNSGMGVIKDYHHDINDEVVCEDCVIQTHFFCNECDELELMENCVAQTDEGDGVICMNCKEELNKGENKC